MTDAGEGKVERQLDVGAPSEEKTTEYPPMRTVITVMVALYLAMFLVALVRAPFPQRDGNIPMMSVAGSHHYRHRGPEITDEFDSTEDIGWYGSAYVLTACSTQLLFGRLYSFYNHKYVFLGSVALFEVGSVLCGAAPTSLAFILGRAIAGAGAAGVFAGVIVLMIPLVPLKKRPMYQGLLGAVFGISSVVGPLVGGAFTNNPHLTWRWCFYINLVIGAMSIALITLFLHIPAPPQSKLSSIDKFK